MKYRNIEYISIPIKPKQLRAKCHLIFDSIWKEGLMSRKDAYEWLANKMFIDVNHCHFRQFGRQQMLIALELSIKYLNDNYTNHDLPMYKIL